jgi:hypothetical protein
MRAIDAKICGIRTPEGHKPSFHNASFRERMHLRKVGFASPRLAEQQHSRAVVS